MKWFWKNFHWIMACAAGVGATPAAFQYAYSVRGYQAIGGEILVPFVVPLFWYLVATLKEFYKEFGREGEYDVQSR